MQNELDRETASLQELEAQKQDAQDRLDEMDQQKNKLEDMMNEVRIKCQEESQMVRKGEGKCGVEEGRGAFFKELPSGKHASSHKMENPNGCEDKRHESMYAKWFNEINPREAQKHQK